jgi:predicted  nucleic acid-binding Zn-ribbon protein
MDRRESEMDDETENQSGTAQQKPGLRERIGQRAWVRSAALVGGGLIIGGIVAGTVTANAADDGRAESSMSERDGRGHHGPRGGGDPSQPQRDDEELLTGDTAEQVTEAVLAEYPDATIERVETDSDGVYEAHIVTTDDERLTVLVNEDFEVTGTESHD